MARSHALARVVVGACVLLLVATPTAWTAAAEVPAWLTIVDGSGTVVSSGLRHAAVTGMRVGPCDIVSTNARSMIQIETGDGARVEIGPGSKLLTHTSQPHEQPGHTQYLLLEGWVKVSITPGRAHRPQRVKTRFADLLVNSGVAVLNASHDRVRLFAEQGDVAALEGSDPAAGRRKVAAGRLFVRSSGRGEITQRASAAFLADMPAAFRDTVPSRLAQVAAAGSPRPAGTDARLPDLLDWFALHPARPACLSPWLIRAVQRALEAKGLRVGPVDGVLGLRTQAALREFQERKGLAASGQPDAATVASLSREDETAGR
jgi:hypothetical protein